MMAMAVQRQQQHSPQNNGDYHGINRGQQLQHQHVSQALIHPTAPAIPSGSIMEYQRLLKMNRLNLAHHSSPLKGQGKPNGEEIASLESRKRSREFEQGHTELHGHPALPVVAGVSTGLQLGVGNKGVPAFFPAVSSEVSSQLQQQRREIHDYLRVQEERLRQMVADKSQQHSRMLLSTIDKHLARCFKEKAMSVEGITRRNKELEDKLKQLSVEARMWQMQARDYEGLVTSLRNNLQLVREGCGDSEAETSASASSYRDEDAHARVFMENKLLKEQRTCRLCKKKDVCILLLPCQHLCLCKECETRSEMCPICLTAKDASFQVFM